MQNIDFLPESIRQKRARRRRLVRQVYILFVCVAALGLMGYARHTRIARARAEVGMLRQRAENIQVQLETRNGLEQQMIDLMRKKRVDDQFGSRVDVLDVLKEIARVLPKSMALSKLNIDVVDVPRSRLPRSRNRSARAQLDGASDSGGDVKRMELVITGLAPSDVDVANFIGQMSASPMFEDVNMGYARTVSFHGRSAREFKASCYVAR